MRRQGTFWAYILRPRESERQRQANVHCNNIDIAKTYKQKKVHKQMNGQRRNDIRTKWNSSLGKKMNKAVLRTTVEPRNNHIRLSKSKGYDRGFPGGAVVENLPANARDAGSSPGLGGSHLPRSNWDREPQLLSLRIWSLCPATGGARIVRVPRTAMKSGPRLPQLKKALAQNEDPTQLNK